MANEGKLIAVQGVPRRRVRASRLISASVAVALAAVLLYYSVRGIEWRLVARTAAGAQPGLLVLAVLIASGTLFLRAIRWRLLLNAEGAVGVGAAFWGTAAGYFGNNFLPARAGELVRTFLISSQFKLDNAFVLATALSERVADAVALVAISAVVLLTIPLRPGWLAGAAKPFAVLGLVGVSLIVVLPWLEGVGRRLVDRAPLPHGVRMRLAVIMEQALRGIRTFHHPQRLLGFVGLTIVIWSIDALTTVIGAVALGLSMPLSVAFLLVAALGLSSALPATPGYVGIYQFVAVTVLTPFGFTRTDAITYILVAQALSYLVIAFWGALGLLHYRRAGLSVAAAAAKSPPR
jgi:uncharacterized protein (TIRG00374 family)